MIRMAGKCAGLQIPALWKISQEVSRRLRERGRSPVLSQATIEMVGHGVTAEPTGGAATPIARRHDR